MDVTITTFTKSPFGRIIYRPIQSLIHLCRRLRHPDVPLDHKITRVSYGQRKFSILHRRWTGIEFVIAQCFAQAQYDMPSGAHGVLIERIYREIVAAGKKPLIVDCGANIGASVLWFTARYPEAHIVAIEPSPVNFALLRKNCLGLDIDLRQAGIGPADGNAWMSNPEAEGGCTTNDRHDGIDVAIVSLNTILSAKPATNYSPFILKVDIEGAEKSLFTGPASVLGQFPLIVMEPHDWLFPGQRTSVEFFRFHAQTGREFAMRNENIASIVCDPSLIETANNRSI
ncbi:MAG: FkbM family methyltransferase [Terracidiphilus sp.]|jgi:FkbM family methyltransferase